MDNSYRLLDLIVYGRQEKWEDSESRVFGRPWNRQAVTGAIGKRRQHHDLHNFPCQQF